MKRVQFQGDNIKDIRTNTPSLTTNPSQHVIIIETGMYGEKRKPQLINTALALQKYGHKTTIFTSSNIEYVRHDLQNFTIREVGKWVPELISGQYKYLMYVYRSLYTALKSVLYSPNPKASVYITDCSIFALIVLVFMNRTSVIHMQNINELVLICNNKVAFNFVLRWAYKMLSSYANEIILPSVQALKKFEFLFTENEKNLTISYPSIDIGLRRTSKLCESMYTDCIIPQDGYLLVAFGKFNEKSNLKFTVAAFARAMDGIPNEEAAKINLIVTGTYNEHSPMDRKYYEALRKLVISNEYALNITLLKNISAVQKRQFLTKCLAVLHTNADDVFNPTILEAMCLGKTVIALDSGFASEVIVNRITGFLLPKDTERFAAVIQQLVRRKILCVYIGILANKEFTEKYCFNKFSELLNNSIAKHSASFWCRAQSIHTLYLNDRN